MSSGALPTRSEIPFAPIAQWGEAGHLAHTARRKSPDAAPDLRAVSPIDSMKHEIFSSRFQMKGRDTIFTVVRT
jgi:hypothetical protein